MYGVAIETVAAALAQYGLVVLVVVFALEGALVGKLIPTRVLFVAAVLAVGTTAVGVASVFAAAVVGATIGQFALFATVRYTDLTPARLQIGADPSAGGRVTGWLDRWGLSAVAISNVLPLARGSLTIPVAMTDEDALRFSASSLLGTSVYACGLLAVASGLDLAIALL